MTVLHIGKYFPPFSGGIENFVADLLPVLARKGMNVAAMVHNHVAGFRGEMRSVEPEGDGEAGAESGSPGSQRLYRAPCFGQLLYAPISPQFPYWLHKAIKVERPSVLHLHMPNTSAFGALFLPAARRIPWVVHWHSDVVASDFDWRLKLAYPLYRPFEQRLLRKARAIIVTSPRYLERSSALMPWRDKCRVIPVGLDTARIPDVSVDQRKQAEKRWGEADFRILSVGRLTYYKGHEYLINALTALPRARVVIVGEGERRSLLTSTITNSGLGDRVSLAGKLPTEELHAMLATCDCLCLPSIERTEAFGVVLLEAMAHGKPAVVCDIPGSGVGWVVQDGITGRVVPPANSQALAETLREMSRDRDALADMGAKGRQRYDNMFRMDRIGDEIRQLYEDVLNE